MRILLVSGWPLPRLPPRRLRSGQRCRGAAIARLVPDARIESIAPAPMSGWYSAVVNGSDVYVSADGEYLLSGALWKVARQGKPDRTGAR